MRIAFKEWAVVVDALGHGEQIIILRKGGMAEGAAGFKPEHSRFWLFPTLFHQQRESVLESAQKRWDELQPVLPPVDLIRIEYYAEVVDWKLLATLEEAQKLKGRHIWSDEIIASRFDWGKQKNIHALVVRVYRLPAPVELSMSPAYAGCKSWIELEQDLDVAGCLPVLTDAEMQAKRAALSRK